MKRARLVPPSDRIESDLLDELRRLRISADLRDATAQELVDTAQGARESGNLALLAMLKKEADRRMYESDADRALVKVAIGKAIAEVEPEGQQQAHALIREVEMTLEGVEDAITELLSGRETKRAEMKRVVAGQHRDNGYPKDSIILVDEYATNEPDNLNKGMGLVVPDLANDIKEMCRRWKIRPRGVADDAIFSQTGSSAGSIADEFRRAGVYFSPARKAGRVGGWNVMRRLLGDAGKPDVPGLYVSRSCEYFWQTAPFIGRDMRRIEDVDSKGPDHGVDAVRYGCLRGADRLVVQKVKL